MVFNEYTFIGIGVVVLVIVAFIAVSINEKKGVDSPERKKIQDILHTMVVLNIQRSINKRIESMKATTYYNYYAVRFKPGSLYVIPLTLADGDIIPLEPVELTDKVLGSIQQ